MSQESILFEKAIKNVNSILKVTGLHLIDDNNYKSFIKRIRRRWLIMLILISINPDVGAEIAWFIDAIIKGKDLIELTYPAPCIAHCFLGNIKAYYFLKNEPLINDLIGTLRRLQSSTVSGEVTNKMEKELKTRTRFLKNVTNVQYWLNVVSIIGFAILPFIVMGVTYYQLGEIQLMMPFVLLYPFDIFDRRIYPFMYLHEMWGASMIVMMVFGPDSLYYACCTFIQIQFRYLHYDLESIVSEKTRKSHSSNIRAKLAACVTRHKELIRCVSIMEQVYAKSTLFNVVDSSMLICLTGFNLTASPSWLLMIPFVGFVFLVSGQIFLFCYFGDIVMRSSLAISDAAYNCRWYNAESQVKKDLLIVLIRAQKPCKLTAYGFSDINLMTFTRILSTAWSYFALLSSVNGSNVSQK